MQATKARIGGRGLRSSWRPRLVVVAARRSPVSRTRTPRSRSGVSCPRAERGDRRARSTSRRTAIIWVAERCGANTCAGSNLPPILEFDPSGKLLKSFGAGLMIFPHGFHVDADGNVWVTDAQGSDGKGHQVFKFSPDGKLLLTLGKAGVAGAGTRRAQSAVRRRRRAKRRHLRGRRARRRARTCASSSSRRTASSSRRGASPDRRRASSTSRTRSRSTRRAGCSSPTAPTTGSRSSTRTGSSSRSGSSSAG